MRRVPVLGAMFATTMLSGCMTMGGTVKGDFACRAPDGICAPSSTIDDRALAMILGETPDTPMTPAGPYTRPKQDAQGLQVASANGATRSREKVLRIVFPSHIDGSGRLYEQTAVHAVVENGGWQAAAAGSPVASTPAEVASSASGGPLFAAVDRASAVLADTGDAAYGMGDPDAPSAAAVAAARARIADPIGDIKAQVAGKLASRPARAVPRVAPPRLQVTAAALTGDTRIASGAAAPAPLAAPAPKVVAASGPVRQIANPTLANPTPTSPSSTPAQAAQSRGPVAQTPGIATPSHATPEGKAAVSALRSNTALGAGVSALGSAVTASKPAAPIPVLRAPSFPGAPQ